MSNSLGETYEEFVAKRQAWWESREASSRVLLAGFFYERNEPLTDEVLATREYLRRKALVTKEEMEKDFDKILMIIFQTYSGPINPNRDALIKQTLDIKRKIWEVIDADDKQQVEN